MQERDQRLLDRVRWLRWYLNQGPDADVAIGEGQAQHTELFRGLGHRLHDIGRDLLIRVNELDGTPFLPPAQCRQPGESES
ncbi:hypothetical protein FB471_6249 [Amycolatopsis cihanbeyliensis]|uniref:Uncharacterized protein n=2 Tax=Amycolatopsis cihanbeyliensis TaxID=1128664 RepID=A0A542CTD8_AMYCI|nr:hypothetical protein FB471_6249 [Amycolatopsis cihanbeyliensis]